MKILTVMLFVITLSACTTTKYVYVDRIVEVPKIVFKDVPFSAEVIKPELMIYTLKKEDNIDNYLNSCIISLEESINYSKKLEIAIEPYTKVE